MALKERKAVEIREAWQRKLKGFEQLDHAYAGDPRKDLDPPSCFVEFVFPDLARQATGGVRDVEWSFLTTFCFDSKDWAEAEEAWELLSVELLNAMHEDPHLGTTGGGAAIQRWRVEDEAVPETAQAHARSGPMLMKTVRFIAETEER